MGLDHRYNNILYLCSLPMLTSKIIGVYHRYINTSMVFTLHDIVASAAYCNCSSYVVEIIIDLVLIYAVK